MSTGFLVQGQKRQGQKENPLLPVIAVFFLLGVILYTSHYWIQKNALYTASTIGTSMLPTVTPGDTQTVDRMAYMFHPPRRGDVIVFWAPPLALKLAYWSDAKVYEKRVLGLPGDALVITNSTTTINGVQLDEPYVHYHGGLAPGRILYITVPPGDLFVMGDNRAASFDSRAWGMLPESNLIGRVDVDYRPLYESGVFVPDVITVFL
jgi:signal peptidase I